MRSNAGSSCCGCLMAFIILIVVLVLVVAFAASKFFTINELDSKVGLDIANKEGVLAQFSDSYSESDTFASLGMADWKVWDVFMWIIKSGDYKPDYAK